MNKVYKNLLEQVADLHEVPMGAYNLRADGEGVERKTTDNINIVTKEDQPGIDIIIKAGTKNESVHIPVVLSQSGLKDMVYNDFYIGENADVTIVAGCGIDNCGDQDSGHDGIHRFFVGKGAKVKYVEKHYGSGTGKGRRVLNPVTEIEMDEASYMEMETVQIQGVDSTKRDTKAEIGANATLIINESILTEGEQDAETNFEVDLNGYNSSTHVVSRSVAKGDSSQWFNSVVNGNNKCSAHTECDAIIVGNGSANANPSVLANHPDAELIHEATIGKIAGEQLMKLQTLGLDEEQAEEQIISGFIR